MNNQKQGVYGGLILLECLIWGIGNPLTKFAIEDTPVLFFTALRFIIALLAFCLLFRKSMFRELNKGNILKCTAISVLSAIPFIISTFALKLTTATTAGFLMSIAVVFTPLLSYIILKKHVKKRMWLVILLVVLGMYLLCANNGGFSFGLGELIALLCSFLFAAVLVFSSKYINDIGASTLSVMQTLAAAIFSVIGSLIFEGVQPLSMVTPRAWWVIIYLALFSTCAAYLLQNIALQRISPVLSSLAFCTEPLFTAIVAWLILGESLTLSGFGGAAIMLGGMVLAAFLPAMEHEQTDASILSVDAAAADATDA